MPLRCRRRAIQLWLPLAGRRGMAVFLPCLPHFRFLLPKVASPLHESRYMDLNTVNSTLRQNDRIHISFSWQNYYVQNQSQRPDYQATPILVNFVPAVAYHLCLSLPAPFSQPGNSLIVQRCGPILFYLDDPQRGGIRARGPFLHSLSLFGHERKHRKLIHFAFAFPSLTLSLSRRPFASFSSFAEGESPKGGRGEFGCSGERRGRTQSWP